jgi:hypothetical protein
MGSDDWVERMRELARRDAEEILPRPAFTVFGLAAPVLRPLALAETRQLNGTWDLIGLAYGDWTSPDGPWVSVATAPFAADPTEGDLRCAIDDERNRLADHADIYEEEPPEPPAFTAVTIHGGMTGLACCHGTVQAASVTDGHAAVLIVARAVALDDIRLTTVTDLAPYLQGRNDMIGKRQQERRYRMPPPLQPAEGMAAYRALLDAELQSHDEFRVALETGRIARRRPDEGAIRREMWQRAVRELANRAAIGLHAADDIITSLVNHLISLDEEAPWFTADPNLREHAIDESLRYAVLDEQVPSVRAQQAWAGYWQYRSNSAIQNAAGPLQPAARLGADRLKERWQEAWTEWTWRRGR